MVTVERKLIKWWLNCPFPEQRDFSCSCWLPFRLEYSICPFIVQVRALTNKHTHARVRDYCLSKYKVPLKSVNTRYLPTYDNFFLLFTFAYASGMIISSWELGYEIQLVMLLVNMCTYCVSKFSCQVTYCLKWLCATLYGVIEKTGLARVWDTGWDYA